MSPDGHLGRRDLSPRYLGVLSQARHTGRLTRGLLYGGGVWSGSTHLLLGQRVYRPALFGDQHGVSGGGVPLLFKTLPNRNVLLGPEKSRVPFAQIASCRAQTAFALVNCSLFSIHLDRLSRFAMPQGGMGEDDPSHGALRSEFIPARSEVD